MRSLQKVAIALGSNLGDRLATLISAAQKLQEDVISEAVMSSVYESPPWGPIPDQPPFLNAVIVGNCEWKPPALVSYLKSLEREMGRSSGLKYGPRVLDVDLIAVGDEVWKSEGVEVPHPRMTERDFVLLPLQEVWPTWVHPTLGKDVPTLLQQHLKTQPSSAKVFSAPPLNIANR